MPPPGYQIVMARREVLVQLVAGDLHNPRPCTRPVGALVGGVDGPVDLVVRLSLPVPLHEPVDDLAQPGMLVGAGGLPGRTGGPA